MTNLTELSRDEKLEYAYQLARQARLDPALFIDRFCYTFDPRTPPYHLPFELYHFQRTLVYEIKAAIENGNDIFIEKCRDMGATYTLLDVFLWFWLYIPGSNFLIGSRKQDYVDSSGSSEISNKEESLFGKLEYTMRRLPRFMLPQGFDFRRHMTFMAMVNPQNGNAITGESSNPNFSRSGRFKAVFLDEFAFWDNDTQAWGATADTTNCRIVITTPGIKPGKAKRLRFGKDGEQIKVIELDKSLDPRKDMTWENRERSRRSREDYAREIDRNWEVAITGRVYDEIHNATLGEFLFESNWPLYVSWDFGLDGTAIQFWQPNKLNGKMRIIDSYFNTDKPIQFFFPLFGLPIDSTFLYTLDDQEAIDILKILPKATHFGDPDVAKRAYQSSTTVSTRDELRKAGIHVQTKPESNTFYIRREKTKLLLQKGIEVNNTKRNETWLEALTYARYPQRDESSQQTTAINDPIHDWTSHHRTATEYFAVNYEVPVPQYITPPNDISNANWSLSDNYSPPQSDNFRIGS